MTDTTIKLSNSKNTDLEFDVSIQGLNEDTIDTADVRFVITNADDRFNMSVKCIKTEGTKWMARIPAPKLQNPTQDFRVEVIVDGYYFEPVAGSLILVSEPTVGITEHVAPTVSVKAAFSQTDTTSAVINETPTFKFSKKLVESLTFNEDPTFARQFQSANKILMKSASVIEKGIAPTGAISKQNKLVVAEAIETGKKIISAMEKLFYKKAK
jgi:hypothetical protein